MGADQYAWYEIYPQFERVQAGDIFFANRRPFPKLRQRYHGERFTHCGMIWGQTVPAEYLHNQGEIRLHKAERMFVDQGYLWWTHEATAWKGLVRGVAQPQRDFDETLVVLRARGRCGRIAMERSKWLVSQGGLFADRGSVVRMEQRGEGRYSPAAIHIAHCGQRDGILPLEQGWAEPKDLSITPSRVYEVLLMESVHSWRE